jgi:hypothetical protein
MVETPGGFQGGRSLAADEPERTLRAEVAAVEHGAAARPAGAQGASTVSREGSSVPERQLDLALALDHGLDRARVERATVFIEVPGFCQHGGDVAKGTALTRLR